MRQKRKFNISNKQKVYQQHIWFNISFQGMTGLDYEWLWLDYEWPPIISNLKLFLLVVYSSRSVLISSLHVFLGHLLAKVSQASNFQHLLGRKLSSIPFRRPNHSNLTFFKPLPILLQSICKFHSRSLTLSSNAKQPLSLV